MIRRLLGYRGLSLTFLALVWFAVGARLLVDPNDPGSHLIGHRLPLEYLPIWLRVAIWWAAALAAVVTAWWPKGKTKWGFVALVVPASFRAISFTGALLLGAHGGLAWVDAAVWVGITSYVMVLADWPEPAVTEGGSSP